MCRSEPQMPAARMRTFTPAPDGRGTSTTSMPLALTRTARMTVAKSGCVRPVNRGGLERDLTGKLNGECACHAVIQRISADHDSRNSLTGPNRPSHNWLRRDLGVARDT